MSWPPAALRLGRGRPCPGIGAPRRHHPEVAIRESLSPVERLEMMLHPWVSFGVMPLFALANAGLPLSLADPGDPVALAVFLGFTIGKPAGVWMFGWLAVLSGLAHRPMSMSWSMLAGGGLLAGIGFSMALFIADVAFPAELIDSAKLGILAGSVVSATLGLAVLAWLTAGERGASAEQEAGSRCVV